MMGVIKDIAAIPNIGLKENHTMSTQNAYHFLEHYQHLNFSLDIDQFSLPSTQIKKIQILTVFVIWSSQIGRFFLLITLQPWVIIFVDSECCINGWLPYQVLTSRP